MEQSKAPFHSKELTVEEKESVLRALGYYQVYLFDRLRDGKESKKDLDSESQRITSAIKKIHKTIEEDAKNR
ncbi:MAG: hypothetical protein M1587_02445 [Thaumarchaeota archaeon]|nr:hypothetical protein [Nitrososphaerota archaeon]